MFCTAIVGFSQVKLDYTAKPKAEAKGFSAKGLSETSAQFLHQLKQAEAMTDRSAKASAYAKLQREYDPVQGKVPAIQVNQRLKAKISTRYLTGRLVMSRLSADGHYRLPSAGIYILRINGFKPRKVMLMGR